MSAPLGEAKDGVTEFAAVVRKESEGRPRRERVINEEDRRVYQNVV